MTPILSGFTGLIPKKSRPRHQRMTICIMRLDFPIPVPPLMIMEEPRVSQRLPMRLSGSLSGSKLMRSLIETTVDLSSSDSREVR